MSIIRASLSAVALAALLASTTAYAQSTAPGAGTSTAPAVAFVDKQSVGEASHSSIVGLAVKNTADEKIGDVNYLVMDPKGQVTTVVIGVGGFLGMGEKNVGVPYSSLSLMTDKDGNKIATIATTKAALESAPKYEWTEKTTAQIVKEKATHMADQAKKAAQDLAEKAKEMTATEKPKTE